MLVMFYYIYKITCTNINHKFYNHYYIGKRISDIHPNYDRYKGSGKLINEYYKEYPNDYNKEIICLCTSLDELNQMETKYIKENINNELCLNLFRGGLGGNTFDLMNEEDKLKRCKNISKSNKGKIRKFTEEHKQNLSISLRGIKKDVEWRKHLSESKRNKKLTEEHKLHIKQGNHHIGHKLTEYEKLKMSLKMKEVMQNKDVKKRISESVKKSMKSEEIRNKCREGGYHTKGLIWITNGIECKRIEEKYLDYYIKLNYHKGRK